MPVHLISRELEKEILPWLDSPQILAIRGPRQSGKTTFLQRITALLEKKGIAKSEIHYVSFEDSLLAEKFAAGPREFIKFYVKENSKKHFFLFDEVQYIKNAGRLLKLVYDEMKNIKIIITGSSTLDLNEVSSSLVGRVLLFEMYPFSFSEFLEAKDEDLFSYYHHWKISLTKPRLKKEKLLFLDKLNNCLKEYILFGGYPAIVLEKDYEKKKILLKNLFLTYVEKDIVKVYGPRYRQRVLDLVRHLASINGGIINYNDLSTLTGLYDKEVKEILSLLADTYIISIVRPFYRNLATELRKNPKVYFVDTGLRNFITGRFEFGDEEYGKLLENYLLGKLRPGKFNYWRTTAKAEVDFIYEEKIPIEVKTTPKITRSFKSYIGSYHPPIAFLVNLNEIGIKKTGSTKICLVPLALL